MRRCVLLWLFSALTLFASNSSITVAAAANVSYAMKALKKDFEALYPYIRVNMIIGSSGKLTAQIRNGAPYDLFLSADIKYPNVLFQEGYAVSQPVVYAQGSLALLCPKGCKLHKGIKLLLDGSIKKIAIANPRTAPYGKAAVEALQYAGIYKQIIPKLLYGESISQTLIYALNAADVGIVATSLLYSPKLSHFQEEKEWKRVDSSLYAPIKQGMILLKSKHNKKGAQLFYEYMQSAHAKSILKNYGYRVSDD